MFLFENSCCFTGYRPEKFNFPLIETSCDYRRFITRLLTSIADMIEKGCTRFYTGMAMGFDILAAEQVITFKKAKPEIQLIAVVPFEGHKRTISSEWQNRYQEILRECDEVVTISPDYANWVYSKRNRYMVDRSRYVLTYFDGKTGGTQNTLKYAVKNGRQVLNIYETDVMAEKNSHLKHYCDIFPPEKQ